MRVVFSSSARERALQARYQSDWCGSTVPGRPHGDTTSTGVRDAPAADRGRFREEEVAADAAASASAARRAAVAGGLGGSPYGAAEIVRVEAGRSVASAPL